MWKTMGIKVYFEKQSLQTDFDNLVREMPDAEIYLFDNNSSYRISKIPPREKSGERDM